jgi:hypothetical protein
MFVSLCYLLAAQLAAAVGTHQARVEIASLIILRQAWYFVCDSARSLLDVAAGGAVRASDCDLCAAMTGMIAAARAASDGNPAHETASSDSAIS